MDSESAGGQPPPGGPFSVRKGFAGIALLLTAVLVLIAAHFGSPLCFTPEKVSESNAVSQLKNYIYAQITFSAGRQGRHPGNTLTGEDPAANADNFRILHYGTGYRSGEGADAGEPLRLHLISKPLADAFLIENALAGAPSPPDAPMEPKAYEGYFFVEDISLRGLDDAADFPAFMAFPERYGEPGRKVFWIGREGTVYAHDPKLPKGTPAHEIARRYFSPTPAGDGISPGWDDAGIRRPGWFF